MSTWSSRIDGGCLIHVAAAAAVASVAAALIWLAFGGCVTGLSRDRTPPSCRPYDPASPNHTAPFIEGMPDLGPVDDERPVDLRIQLPLHNNEGLDQLLIDLYDPQSPRFRRFLTPGEFAVAHLPTQADFDYLGDALTKHGLQVAGEPKGAIVRVTGTAQAARRALGVSLRQVRTPDGRTVIMPTGLASLAGIKGISLKAVHGLADGVHKRAPAPMTATRRPGYSPKVLRQAYGVPDDAPAGGQVIGVIALDGYRPSDMAAHAHLNGLREVPRSHVGLNGWTGAVVDPEAAIEVTLDLQAVQGVASGLREIRLFGAPNNDTAFIDLFTEIANPSDGRDLVPVISCSWGLPETEMGVSDAHALHDVFRQASAQGQSILAASGDLGSRGDGHNLTVDAPAGDPWVWAVGGTTLSVDANGWAGEVAWSGSGGGSSCWWPSPRWQQGLITGLTGGTATARAVPDLALHADPQPGHMVVVDGRPMAVGGTSAAAPLMAGMWALVLQARADRQLPQVGFAPPTLYRLARGPGGKAMLHDCVEGSNGDFDSATGWDNVTGFGSPIYPAMHDLLLAD